MTREQLIEALKTVIDLLDTSAPEEQLTKQIEEKNEEIQELKDKLSDIGDKVSDAISTLEDIDTN